MCEYKMRSRDKNICYRESSSGSESDEGRRSTGGAPQKRPRTNLSHINAAASSSGTSSNPDTQNMGGSLFIDSLSRNGGNLVVPTTLGRGPGRPPRGVEPVGRSTRPRNIRYQKPRRPSNNPGKEFTILSWMIDLGLIFEDHSRVRCLGLEGTVKRAGIFCDCCRKVITVYDFEEHAGIQQQQQRPYANIFLVGLGVPLMALINYQGLNRPQELALRGYNFVDTNDSAADVCLICSNNDGRDLVSCARCPTSFHQTCMSMEMQNMIQQGEMLCSFCICRFCGSGDHLYECKQCQRGYHLDCAINPPKQPHCPDAPTQFCEKSCEEIFSGIQEKFLGFRNRLDEEGLTWSIVRMMDDPEETVADPNNNPEYLHRKTVCNSKVALAWRVMDQIFLSCIDRTTGINIIQSIVYSRESNLRRLNFRNFYTVILEQNDEIVCVATLRMHGKKLAEIPFLGTLEKFRHNEKGSMMQKLLSEIQSVLFQLNVENLTMPSLLRLVSMWEHKYDFSEAGDNLMNDLKNYNTFMFPNAYRLHKPLAAHNGEGRELAASEPVRSYEAKASHFDLNLEPPEDR